MNIDPLKDSNFKKEGHVLTIVSRKSRLALCQSQLVKKALLRFHPTLDIKIIGIQTKGDRFLDTPLSRIGGKGLFVEALEDYLIEKRADIAVHSLKDIPTQLPKDLILGSVLKRDDPRDAWLSLEFKSLETVPLNAHIGTASLRRQAQLLHLRPDLQVTPLRGNIDTRIEKLKQKKYDAIILAQCGIQRLGLKVPICAAFPPHIFLPAVGQGTLAIECREDDEYTCSLIAALHHQPTAACIDAERAMLSHLEGGCQTPIAGFAQYVDHQLELQGMVASPDGKKMLRATASANPNQAFTLGKAVAEQLIAKGADALLKHL